MKLISTILPLVAITTAFVLPDEHVMNEIAIEKHRQPSYFDRFQASTFRGAVASSENAILRAIHAATDAGKKAATTSLQCYSSMMAFDAHGWLDSTVQDGDIDEHQDVDIDDFFDLLTKKPHKKLPLPPHHGPHHKPNKTVYELIASSRYTTKLAKLIDEYPDLVDALNGTAANYTVFAPTDKAFEKIPKHGKRPSKELIHKVLSYHVSPDFYHAGRLLMSHTIPTILDEDALGREAQRLRVHIGLRGWTVNFYSKIVALNIFGTNGVIHGVDSLLLPPPPAFKIIELLPGQFSTLQLALKKTGLGDDIAEGPHTGGTLFAPSNQAFKKLGPKINAFLFSKYGTKYLKALLKYHIVANQTLYSDAFYKTNHADTESIDNVDSIPKGRFHVNLPTLLDDKRLSIDIARWGGFITMQINGFNNVAVQDGIAHDGVIHVMNTILNPPKTPRGPQYMGEEMSVKEFKDRFNAYVEEL